jgi:hypothetical protein
MTALTHNTTPWQLRPELCREVVWHASNSEDALLCLADVDGQRWSVVLNPVDASALYALYVGDRHVLDFEDWPGFWRWPS